MVVKKKVSYIKECLVKRIETLVKDKKERLNVHTLSFEEDDLPNLGGALRVGFYVHFKQKSGVVKHESWEDIPAITLVKIEDILKQNRFYGEKNVKGQNCKVRLKK